MSHRIGINIIDQKEIYLVFNHPSKSTVIASYIYYSFRLQVGYLLANPLGFLLKSLFVIIGFAIIITPLRLLIYLHFFNKIIQTFNNIILGFFRQLFDFAFGSIIFLIFTF